MTFDSVAFFVLFWTVALLYFGLPGRFRNPLLLTASVVFYAWWRWEYIFVILLSITIDYFVSFGIAGSRTDRGRRVLLAASLVSNLGLLFFFKYFNFACQGLSGLLGLFSVGWTPPWVDLVLPIGISFHTFQALSYTIDVYRGTTTPEPNLLRLYLYVLFFPQLVAGPIERSTRLLPQFSERHEFDAGRVTSGLRLMLWGLVKKVAIADPLALLVDPVYSHPASYGGWPLVISTYAFAFQIYADFSAYSDIAVGTARVLGFRLMQNFDRPYFAASPADFWKRWHISLSTWFRDYVYIPLGGSRAGAWRWAGAVLVTFLLSGLWHGARWTFVIWGAYHGLLLIAGRARRPAVSAVTRVLVTFHLVLMGWILFRAESLSDALHVLTHALGPTRGAQFYAPLVNPSQLALAGVRVAALLAADGWAAGHGPFRNPAGWPRPVRWTAYGAGALLLLNAGTDLQIPFIYFQF